MAKAQEIHYRCFVYNVVDNVLRAAFPLTYSLLAGEEWDFLIEEFLANRPCKFSQQWSIPKEFYDYVMLVNHPLCKKYSFLGALLRFEWLEIEI